MKSKLIIEQMAKREREIPTKLWRVVWRECTEHGLSSRGFRIVDRSLTFARARKIFVQERSPI